MALRLAIAAIFRNEGPYISEWIAHHRALGIERFFVADNDSTDETTATLAALAAAGIVHHVPFPSVPGRPAQQAAYAELLCRFGGEADWIAFLDADEFLMPAAITSLPEVIAALAAPDVGSIAVNWAIYGSSGQKQAGERPVTLRFGRRAERTHPVNRHYKSIVRPEAVEGPIRNPHYLPLKAGFRPVHADGSEVVDAAGLPRGLSARTVWKPLRINHYVVKSWEEFYWRKRPRGRATRSDRPRDAAFFAAHDRNEVADPVPAWLVGAAEEEGRRIEAVLRREGRSGLAAWKARLATLARPFATRGEIEAVEIRGRSALIRGWALAPGSGAEEFAVRVGERPAEIARLVRIRRSDVIARFPGARADCGFNLGIAWPLPPGASGQPVPLTVIGRRSGKDLFALSMPPQGAWRVIDAADPPPAAAAGPVPARRASG